ncbi:PREDICTED: uncharacterized protein LOC109178325 isoform X1 [Ipomoea nil]|uniref:uncharacterized protein LOC109178325 isoform X1 n=1 Tax=Ipomoea nil TaxID=35883 RepID=UPI000901E583|nr:PREDICTED: uncharacterized protein LOC109178325 isoform X1 [Ipomoea nil]XP_019183503.1 PREDICTED: uncharacterized protein LOC109178325 isoform X1 [Ipomoea nil]
MGWDASSGWNNLEPDYFGFYKCEIAELLSEDEDFLPSSLQIPVSAENLNGNKASHRRKECNGASSSSLFSNCIGPEVSGIKMVQLKSLLRQGVFALSEEVDEKVDFVFNICRLQSFLRFNGSLITSSSAGSDFDQGNPCKKLKPSTLSSPASDCQDVGVSASRGEISNNTENRCTESHTEAPQGRSSPEGTKPFHNACRPDGDKGTESLLMNEKNSDCLLGINVGAAKEDQDVDDLPFLLQNDSSTVEEVLKKHSDDLSVMLEKMEQKLEELLDIVMSKCRLMTLSEKQQLQRMIKNLPPRNLDSVVKIIQRHRKSNANSCHEIHIDLEKEDNVTLWRLYFYIEAVENAKKLRNG